MTDAPASARVELARLALNAALAHPDVRAGDPGPAGTCVTTVDGDRTEGVSVVAEGSGGSYAVTLSLRTRIVPLRPLSEELRERVRRAAAVSALAGSPSSIEIQIVDVDDDLVAPSATLRPPL